MNKKFRKALSVFMAFALTASSASLSVSAKTSKSNEALSTKSVQTMKSIKESKNSQKNTATFKEGEAVVMYYGTPSTTYSNASLFGSDMTIESTWDFSGSSASKASTDSKSVTNASLLVSKISSNKLSTSDMIKQLKKRSDVVYAEPNYIYKATSDQVNGTYADYQWALDNEGQNSGTVGLDMNPDAIWNQGTTGTEKVIAIIDTGVDYTHPDLKDNIWQNPYTSVLKGDHGYDFVNYDADPLDDNGHGSHCAGIIAGSGEGISGVNQSAKIMALKFLDDTGSGDLSGAVGAYDYIGKAIDLGVDVVAINNAWGGGEGSDIMKTVVDLVGEKGAISVCAAGNDGLNVDEAGADPWTFESDYKISVAASNENDELASFSCYGVNGVDLAAPGADILSSVCYDCFNPTIHSGEKDYTEFYNDYNQMVDTTKVMPLNISGNGTAEITEGSGVSFGVLEENGSSIHYSLDASSAGYYGFYIPVTLPESNTDYYMSAAIKAIFSENYEFSEDYALLGVGIEKVSTLQNANETWLMNSETIGLTGAEAG